MSVDRVIFRTWRDRPETVIAILPDQEASPGLMMMYEHVGQHGEGDYYHVLGHTRPSLLAEYADLLLELRSIGYNPRLYRRIFRR